MKVWLYDQYLWIAGVKRTKNPLKPFYVFGDENDPYPEKWYVEAMLDNTSMEPWEHEVHYGVRRFLKKIKFPRHKPPAMIGIDDRVLTFDGTFPDPQSLTEFKPWNK